MQRTLINSLGISYLETRYEKEQKWVNNNWIGYVMVEEVKAGADACLDLVKENGCSKLLNDNTNLTGPWDQANEWIATNWMPRALALGLKQFAHVVSEDVFGAISAEDMQTRVNEFDFEMRIFSSKSEAEQWLHQH